jgi:hypothetical protein
MPPAATGGGLARRRTRPTMPIEPILVFYPKYFSELARKTFGWLAIYLRLTTSFYQLEWQEALTDGALTRMDEQCPISTAAARSLVRRVRPSRQVQQNAGHPRQSRGEGDCQDTPSVQEALRTIMIVALTEGQYTEGRLFMKRHSTLLNGPP